MNKEERLRALVAFRRKHFHHLYSTFRAAEMEDETGQTKNGWQIYLAHVNAFDEVLKLIDEAALADPTPCATEERLPGERK